MLLWVAGSVEAEPSHLTPSLGERLISQSKSLWQAFTRKDILLPTAFVFLWQVSVRVSVSLVTLQ